MLILLSPLTNESQGGYFPNLAMVENFRGDDHCFAIFDPIRLLWYDSAHADWPPLSAEKINVSLYH